MKVPPVRASKSGSLASAAMTRPGYSTEQPFAGRVAACPSRPGILARLRSARSVKVRPCHSASDATPCGFSSIAMSRAIRSTADFAVPKMTP